MSTANLSISEAILQVLPSAPAAITTADVTAKVRALLWSVSQTRVADESIRTTLSTMANDANTPVTGSRFGYSLTPAPANGSDLERVTNELRRVFNAVIAKRINITPDGYPAAPGLALVDAIFSANSRYEAVINVIRRLKTRFDINDGEEFTVNDLFTRLSGELAGVDKNDAEEHLLAIFGNATYSTKGLRKATQVIIIGNALLNLPELHADLPFALDTHSDWERIGAMQIDQRIGYLDRLEQVLTSHRGMGPATFRYLLLLNGIQVVKPDRMILRFLSRVLNRPEALIRPREAAELVESATSVLQSEGYPFSVISADHVLWQVESGRLNLELTDEQPGGLPAPTHSVTGVAALSSASEVTIPDRSRVHRNFESHGAGDPCGLVMSHDDRDASRVVVVWRVPGLANTSIEDAKVSIESVDTLRMCSEGDAPAQEAPSTADLLAPLKNLDFLRSLAVPTVRQSGGNGRTNHDKLAEALSSHRGETLSLDQMWQIVHARWGQGFDKGSFLPNDHASGNAGACWCAENRQNQPLFRRVGRGRYLVL